MARTITKSATANESSVPCRNVPRSSECKWSQLRRPNLRNLPERLIANQSVGRSFLRDPRVMERLPLR